MEYSVIDQADNKQVVFYGNIRPSSRSAFIEIAEGFKGSDKKKWVFDVTEFEFIDSAGLGLFIELSQKAKESDVDLAIIGANDLVRRMFDLSKFDTFFELMD